MIRKIELDPAERVIIDPVGLPEVARLAGFKHKHSIWRRLDEGFFDLSGQFPEAIQLEGGTWVFSRRVLKRLKKA